MSDRVAETSTRQLITISKDDMDAPGRIRTRNPGKVADPCFRRRGHRHRLVALAKENMLIKRHGVSNFKIATEHARLKLALVVHTKAVRPISFISY